MKKNTRMIRINDEIMHEVAQIIRAELKDPRIAVMTSVIKVETTNDLAHAKIFVSIYGNEEQKKEVMQGLKNASGFIRKQIAQRINLRATPMLQFVIDDSLEYSARIAELISEVNNKEDKNKE